MMGVVSRFCGLIMIKAVRNGEGYNNALTAT
jgi:hypothetical protein